MKIHPPPGLAPFEVLFDQSEPNPHIPDSLREFVGNIGFPPAPADRPWVFSNFVQSLDGVVTFGGDLPGGEWVARSSHDRWMMDFLRAHADAIIAGAGSLRLEARFGKIPGGPVYRIVDDSLLEYRSRVLGKGKLKVIIVSGRGRLAVPDLRLFRSTHVEAMIATTPFGARELGDTGKVPVIVSGEGRQFNCKELVRHLRKDKGIGHLLCEGGPGLYGTMLRAGCIDENFLTIAPQEIGLDNPPDAKTPMAANAPPESVPRLARITGPGFSTESAPWFEWISCRKAGHHSLSRYRRTRKTP